MRRSLQYSSKVILLFMCTLTPVVVLAQWSLPFDLSPSAVSAGLNESMGSCIGVSGDTIHVVYCDRFNLTHGTIYYTRSTDSGLTWSAPVAITSLNANSFNPAIAVNGSSIHVVWRNIDTINNNRSSHYIHSLDGGNTWGNSMTIDSPVADWPAIAVSGNHVYVANDIVTAALPYNTEIFLLHSEDNGATWSTHQQITFAEGRSEDEALTAQGSHLFMSWNDNRSGQMQIFTKHSKDYGAVWDSDVAVIPPLGYGTMVWMDGAFVDVVAAGAPSGNYQTLLAQSPDTGATWLTDTDLTNDSLNSYYYPDMVRDGDELHVVYVKVGTGAQYLHSADGGSTWDAPYTFGNSGITSFIAYSGCVLNVIVPDSGHIHYFRNPTGNAGMHCNVPNGFSSVPEQSVLIYPNPFSTSATIEVSSFKNQSDAVLKVYDVYDKSISSINFNGSNKIIFKKEKLSSGIYFYEIDQGARLIARGKILIQ